MAMNVSSPFTPPATPLQCCSLLTNAVDLCRSGSFAPDIGPDGLDRVIAGHLIMQHHVEQRLMHANAAVVFNKAKVAEAIHKKVHARSCGADHLRQSLLRNLWNQCYRFAWFSEFRHEQEH